MADERNMLGLFRAAQPLLTALGDGRRQQIILLLLDAPAALSVGEISTMIGLSQPAISHHLKILRDAGIVSVERVGTSRLYALEVDGTPVTALKELVDELVACLAEPR